MEENIKRNLDGIYFRIKRNGEYDNICFSDLTSEEKEYVLENKDVEWLKSMCMHMADVIRELGDDFEIIAD